jgi:hypothetical protein
MFTWLRSLISAAAVVELHGSRFRVRDLSGKTRFEFEPILSIDGAQRVVSIGRPIPASAVKTYSPFSGPSALAEDWRIAELILAYAYSKLGSVSWLRPAPRIVLSVMQEPLNGMSGVDDETLVKLSTSAGARKTVVHRGKPVSDLEAIGLLDATTQ